jgi:ABC-type lipoprotein export system ATPase subunit
MAVSVHIKVESSIKLTPRVKQLSGMFDAPIQKVLSHKWDGDVPIDERPWGIGLIVGPSGSGKSTVMRHLFGEQKSLTWNAMSVIDDFDSKLSINQVTDACSAVGFNTIPSWAKPYAVLSTGEKFRVDLARHLIEGGDLVVVDEFTSVIDRQVAQIGSHAVQKYIRKTNKKFVGVTCHYDVIEWLQPDWMLEPATMTFQWRAVQRRPDLEVEIARVERATAWPLFAPFHYLTAELHRAAACYCLFVGGVPASFAGVLHRPHYVVHDIKGVSRVVTLPDFQGMGLAMALLDTLGAAHSALGHRFRMYPAHPSLVRSFDRSKFWKMIKTPGVFSPILGKASTLGRTIAKFNPDLGKSSGFAPANRTQDYAKKKWHMGSRPCAVFEYVHRGDPMCRDQATSLITGEAASGLRTDQAIHAAVQSAPGAG